MTRRAVPAMLLVIVLLLAVVPRLSTAQPRCFSDDPYTTYLFCVLNHFEAEDIEHTRRLDELERRVDALESRRVLLPQVTR